MHRARWRFAVGLIAFLLFCWLALGVRAGASDAFDTAVRQLVLRIASPMLTAAMRGFSLLGETYLLVPLVAIAAVCFWRTGRKDSARLVVVGMAGAALLDQVLKLAFHRLRPAPFFGTPLPGSYSFPSGHALACCTFFVLLAALLATREPSRLLRTVLWTAAAMLTVTIGFSRNYLGVHYATDVLAGFAAAIFWLVCLQGMYSRWFRG